MTNSSERVPVALNGGEGEVIWYLGTLMTRTTGAETTGGAFEVIEARAAPGVSPLWHAHQREDEFFYILEGRVSYYVGAQVIPIEPGAFVRLPRGNAHTFRIEGTEPARLLEIVAPSGLWAFFERRWASQRASAQRLLCNRHTRRRCAASPPATVSRCLDLSKGSHCGHVRLAAC
jgi:uncharacterized cupin superfamily protein